MRSVVLVAATMATGLAAGVFGLYAHTVMPGLAPTDDRTFVAAFQALDGAIINPWFMLTFMGGPVLLGIAAALHWRQRGVLVWVLIALVLTLVGFAVTVGVNVPLNDALKAAGNPDRIADLAEVRRRFDEDTWVTFNLVRTITATVAFFSLCVALIRSGRMS